MKKIGFIDYFLDEWHAENYPAWIKEKAGGEFTVAYAWGKIDPEGKQTNREWADRMGIELLPTIDEVIEKSDVLVVLSPDNPEMHEELCEKTLASGKRTYVDKTFATDRETAIRIFDHARKHNTPLFSTSALRFADEYRNISTEEICNISSWGPGRYSNYSIHQVEPIVALMGTDAKRVMGIGTKENPALVIEFADGKLATLHMYAGGSPFSMAMNLRSGESKVLNVQSDFFKNFIAEMLDFFRDGQPKVDEAQTVAVITIIEYGSKALQNPYVWVDLPNTVL